MDDKHQDDQVPSTSAYQSIRINNEENESNTLPVDSIRRYLAEKLSFFRDISDTEEDKGIQVLETVDFKGLVKHWKSGGFKKIVTMVGAGISTCNKFVIY